MKSIQWPTAVVMLGAFALLAFLAWRGVPSWALGMVGGICTAVTAYMEGLFSGGTPSGGGTLSKGSGSTSSMNGPVPPAASRLAYRLNPRPMSVRLAWPMWIKRSIGFAVGIVGLFVLWLAGCSNGVPNPATVQDVTIGLNAAVCVLGTYTTDISAGKSDVDAIADCVVKCGVSAAQATGLLDAHRKAEVSEGFVPKPAAAK